MPDGAPPLVAALGDSITAGSPYWDPDPKKRASIGSRLDERHQWGYWAQLAHPGIRVRNHGVYGERTDQIAARLDDALAGTSRSRACFPGTTAIRARIRRSAR